MSSERQTSKTAIGVAALRAFHQLFDGTARVLDDPVIADLLGDETMQRVRLDADRLETPRARGLRSHVVLRSRYAEDRLHAAVGRGIRQYVILGAGLDTFAYRQPAWASGLRIAEVDQPASQRTKRSMLARAGIEIPPNLTFADVDFEHETLAQGLARTSVRFDEPAFFSWLGVTMYLTRAAIDATLRTIASFARGSEIVLTFAQPPADGEPARELAEQAASVGEPWISYFRPDEMEAALCDDGFSRVEFLSPDAAAHYFEGTTLTPPRRVSIVSATV
jgi:methyltransferase (TIGR00027 family)